MVYKIKPLDGKHMKTRSAFKSSTRWWDILSVLLLFVILMTAYSRLVATNWTGELTITQSITLLGMLAGLALGQSRFSRRRATFFALVYTLFIVPWRLGLILGEGIPWRERLLSLAGRLGVIFSHLFKQQDVPDSLLFLLLMAVLFWMLSVHAGYSLTRYGNPWRVILPTGLTIIVIHSYDASLTSRVWFLVLYLFFALLLVSRMVYIQQHKNWEQTRTYIPPYLGIDFIRITLVITAVLLLLAWTAPALAKDIPAAQKVWQQVKKPWNSLRDTFGNAFASLRATAGIVSDYYGPNMALGRGAELTDKQIFVVVTPAEPPKGIRYYWRARAYDTYTNGGWSSTLTTLRDVTPQDFDLTYPEHKNRSPDLYLFSFTTASHLATLFVVQQPVKVSRPAKAVLGLNSDGSVDLATLRATTPLRPGETYQIHSTLYEVTVSSLREAGTDYPSWVTDRYLQLPDSITPRTNELAIEITEGLETPYDKVIAVTNYLRKNIEYNETIPEIPSNQEPLDWFLFDFKQGFCNYYASAEVILLRSVGIPARWAVGYAQGEPLEIPNAYNIRHRDAHAWPEVYFPGIGWVEFEPTVSQTVLIRPRGESSDNDNTNRSRRNRIPEKENLFDFEMPLPDEEEIDIPLGNDPPTYLLQILVFAGLTITLILLLIPLIRRNRLQKKLPSIPSMLEKGLRRTGFQPPPFLRRWTIRAALSPLARAYMEINNALTRLGNHPSPTDTPAERTAALANLLPVAQIPAERLLSEYQTATYSQQFADVGVALQAGSKIRSLSHKARIMRFLNGSKNSILE